MVQTTRDFAADDVERNPAADGAVRNHQLRRAEEYVHAHLMDEFSLRDLTEAAGTSSSTLLRTFNAHHGVSPMKYAKRLRLEAVRRSLLDSDPLGGTVSGVASEYGFRQMGRFSADYRRVCGELPSVTLRRFRQSAN